MSDQPLEPEEQLENELLNEERAAKLRQAEEQVKEAAHDLERDTK